jgi:hypothetical protein
MFLCRALDGLDHAGGGSTCRIHLTAASTVGIGRRRGEEVRSQGPGPGWDGLAPSDRSETMTKAQVPGLLGDLTCAFAVVPQVGVEPTTFRLGGGCSIH